MIDIWLLFGLVLPFFAFTLSIFEELVVQSEEEENEKLSQVGAESEADVFYRLKHHKHHHHHSRHDDQQKHHHHHHDHVDQQDHHHHAADSSLNHKQVGSDRRISKVAPVTSLPRVLGQKSRRNRQAVIHLLGRRILPIITAAFCFFYCIVATFLYFFPTLQYGL